MSKRSTFLELKESERAYRRDLILDAAMSLFAERPFHEIGMRDIATEAGISPASIYRYFSSRDDILAEILGHEVSEGSQRQRERLETGRTSLEDIAAGIVDFFMEKEATLQMLNHFLLKEEVDEEAKEKFTAIQIHYLEQFDSVLEAMGCDPDNVRLFSRAFFASLLGIIMSFRNAPDSNSEANKKHVHRLAKLTATIFTKGMP
ncbi:TetR/AcrR family transcriptional regulator [Desulfovermiculus halophilus]|jgi:AcrR family transcriptional regulator|uniref:TetR/AcrR family transcriptional regulator n=1 Tax=Desulfovermiculus halophilus TaxID=339722 RepID=UPI0004875608|nr:TetR/AcrR family transcriptional regulator [Desulfovermiculus halophilus]